jgi:hypothetical protein
MHKLTIKFFVANDTFAPAEFVPIFHRWIQTHALENHLLIDVADYAHVPAGPGTLIVSSQANIHMDRSENRLGLLYVRKQPIAGAETFPETLKGVFQNALAAAALMESEPAVTDRLTFRTDEIAVGLNDRLIYPNAPETIAKYHPLVKGFFKKVIGEETLSVDPSSKSPSELIDLRVKSSGSLSIAALIERLRAVHA